MFVMYVLQYEHLMFLCNELITTSTATSSVNWQLTPQYLLCAKYHTLYGVHLILTITFRNRVIIFILQKQFTEVQDPKTGERAGPSKLAE